MLKNNTATPKREATNRKSGVDGVAEDDYPQSTCQNYRRTDREDGNLH